MAKKETKSFEELAESFGLDPNKINQEKETKLQKEQQIKNYENKDNTSSKKMKKVLNRLIKILFQKEDMQEKVK